MKAIVMGAVVALGVLSFSPAAQAQVCRNAATVDACVSCSVSKGGLNRFSQQGIRNWCAQQLAQRPARPQPASQQRGQNRQR